MKNPFKRTPRHPVLTFGKWQQGNIELDHQEDQGLIDLGELPPGACRRYTSPHKLESIEQFCARTGWHKLSDGTWEKR
jgi:hypothetical protein